MLHPAAGLYVVQPWSSLIGCGPFCPGVLQKAVMAPGLVVLMDENTRFCVLVGACQIVQRVTTGFFFFLTCHSVIV